MVAAVTCDIIKSRKYSNEDRGKVDELIRTAFDETIEMLPDSQADKLSFSIIQGDEFQFVINNPALVYKFVVFYRLILSQMDLKPNFRAGIGIGKIAVVNENSYRMDGSAFHNSRDAYQKFGKPKFRNRITSIICGIEEVDSQLEIIAMYNDYIETKWTDKQKEAIYWNYQTDTLKEASEKINIKYQNVDKRIKKAAWGMFVKGESYLSELIRNKSTP